MKRINYTIVFVFCAILTMAQVTPEAFLAKYPALPGNGCVKDPDQREEYMNNVRSVSKEIDEVMNRLNEEVHANSPDVQKQAMNKYATQYGLSAADVQKLQSGGKMSDKEKRAMANKMMQNSMNVSVDEIANLKNMSKEGKEAWAEAYSTEINADMQADPQKYKKQQIAGKNLMELTMLKKHLVDSLGAIDSKFGQQFDRIENDQERIKMKEEIRKLEERRNNLMGEYNSEVDQLTSEIKTKKQEYCSKYSPENLSIIQNYISHVKSSLPAYYRLQEIETAITKAQTGAEIKMQEGHLALGKVHTLAGALLKAYDYNLFSALDN